MRSVMDADHAAQNFLETVLETSCIALQHGFEHDVQHRRTDLEAQVFQNLALEKAANLKIGNCDLVDAFERIFRNSLDSLEIACIKQKRIKMVSMLFDIMINKRFIDMNDNRAPRDKLLEFCFPRFINFVQHGLQNAVS